MKIPDFVLSWILFLTLAVFIITLLWNPVWISLVTGVILVAVGSVVMFNRNGE